MKIIGIDGLTSDQLKFEVSRGGKFVVFEYCISVFVLSMKRSSNIYFIRNGEKPFLKGIGFTFVSLFFGWWGIPWGPIYTISSVVVNCSGGKNVTDSVVPLFQ